MFSGKTTELHRRLRRLKVIDSGVLVINHQADTRYGEATQVLTHDNQILSSQEPKTTMVAVKELNTLLNTKGYIKSTHILINEAQFFPDLFDFCRKAVDQDEKILVVFGLDGDYQRKPFGEIIKLVPLADKVSKITALCKFCRDGTPGIFTKRIVKNTSQVLIGGEDSYVAVCRKHYLE